MWCPTYYLTMVFSLDPLTPKLFSPKGARGELILSPRPLGGEGGGRVPPGEGVVNCNAGQETSVFTK